MYTMAAIDWSAIGTFLTYQADRPLLFNSAAFFVLFLAFYSLYLLLLRRLDLRLVYTLVFSLYFYYLSSGFFFLLLLLSTLVDFCLGHFIYRATDRRSSLFFLWLSIAANLGLLGYFKYTNFLIDTANTLTGSSWDLQQIFLPVGISFFTFQTMSYSIDIYRGKLVPVTEGIRDGRSFFRSLLDFAFFVSFFPQLVAGPIVRAAEFLPQTRRRPQLSEAKMGQAFLLILGGLFKKAVISDYISVNFVDRVFESPSLYSGLENLLATYGYAIQIYCDFSGYSDMAIGLALLLGFRLPENFNKPYRAVSVQAFWRRWHISLSTWLRDYLYISLGGNRKGRFRTYVNLLITMLLGGLWHGASWVFIVWGGLHGIALALDRYLSEKAGMFSNPALRSLFLWLWVVVLGAMAVQLIDWFEPLAPGVRDHLLAGSFQVLALGAGIAAAGLLFDSLRRGKGSGEAPASRFVSAFLTFHFVCLCWIFFRSGALNNPMAPMDTTGAVLTQLLTAFDPAMLPEVVAAYRPVIGLIILGFILHFLPTRWQHALEAGFLRAPWLVKAGAVAFVAWLVIQTASSELVPFIYFQF